MAQPQPEWSVEHQRHLCINWSQQENRYYRTQYVDGRWDFFDWLPIQTQPRRADSPHDIRERPPVHQAVQGPTIEGTYNYNQPVPNSHVERLDPSYYVRDSSFFRPGKVFSILFSEPAGSTATAYNDSISVVRFGEMVHSQIRRFIVISQKRGDGFCYAIPIFTYGGNGTMKPGVDPSAHAIAYSEGYSPLLLEGESELEKKPICITMTPRNHPLDKASRIFFGIHHPIQHNVKVKDVGKVHPDQISDLIGSLPMLLPQIFSRFSKRAS